MIKAIFFDWGNTLARFDPPREEWYSEAFREFGIEPSSKEILRGISAADRYYLEENAKSPVAKRTPEEQAEIYSYYPKAVLAEAGIKAPPELPLKILMKVMELFKGVNFVLFDDVVSTLKTLKEQKLILGLLTNAAKDLVSVYDELGLKPYLSFVVASDEVGVDKPNPAIFLAALERARVKASEAVHIGDQYEIDVLGARRVGIKPILIDRYDLYPEVDDCPRIVNLTELAQYL